VKIRHIIENSETKTKYHYANATEIDSSEVPFGADNPGITDELYDRLAKYKENIKIPLSQGIVPLYRGINSMKAAILVDSTKMRRVIPSALNDLIDTSSEWSAYPNRMDSIICSPDVNAVQFYGSIYAVFPLNNPIMGMCPADDFWSSFKQSLVYSVAGFNRQAGIITNIVVANDIMKEQKQPTSLRELIQLYDTLNIERHALADKTDIDSKKRRKEIGLLFVNFDGLWNLFNEDFVENIPRLTQVDRLLGPESNRFKLLKQDAINNLKNEYWFEGQAILIKREYIAEFIERMHK
jgi:hypothetical protein